MVLDPNRYGCSLQPYDLSNSKPRRCGLVRGDYKMSSLLQEKCQSPTTDDINKPPEDSSDEVALGQERSEEASDSEFDSPKGKRRTTWLESGQSESPKQEASFDGKPLGNPPSNMRNSSFTSKRSFGNHNGSQRTPRGSQDDVKDEEEDFAGTWCSSQRKRHKAGYGSSSQKLPTLPNIHTSMVGQQKKATSKTSHAEAEKGTNGSKRTKLDGALSARSSISGYPGAFTLLKSTQLTRRNLKSVRLRLGLNGPHGALLKLSKKLPRLFLSPFLISLGGFHRS